MDKEWRRRDRRHGGKTREKSWCVHGCRSRHRVAREKKRREEHEAELEEEAKGEQWAIERREYNMSPEFSMRGTRCEFSFAVDGKMLQFSLGLRVGALTVRCFFNDMENFTNKNPMEDTRCLPRDVAGDKKSLFFAVKVNNTNFQGVAARPLRDLTTTSRV